MSAIMLTKVTLTQLRARLRKLPKFIEGGSQVESTLAVWVCPCKMRPMPNHPFNMAARIELNTLGYQPRKQGKNVVYRMEDSLQHFVDHFTVYNCTAETGKYVHYYIEES